ncbi:nuclear transport factor 2 family protein [Marinicella sediminis]|uniref:Nuclear transport factor 2 family protein n=1 Tax=Marinicella sediminis TaxID=1792834 RepID=A0ABV7JF09_9GAMM|nr:nuclear transport factor 2 family protein [Marinicella sediminis]
MKILLIILILAGSLYACSSSPELKHNRTADEYFSYLEQTPATTEHDVESTFGIIFSDFKSGATESNIRSVYANELYFNDTLKIIYNIDDLVSYMSESAAHVDSTTVDILDVIRSDQDYFIRWSMKMKLSVRGKSINSHSIGMTQLRFNEAGKVVFHQDFWDASEALYEHLPILGRWVKKVKDMM